MTAVPQLRYAGTMMSKLLSISPQVLVLTALVLAPSCTPPDEEDPNDCAADVVGEWESVEEFPCPLVDPTCMYRHTLSFDGANYEWSPDESFDGPYTCSAGVVDARDIDGATVFAADYDAEADSLELIWDGQTSPVPYRRVP
jgi:hypothetical protein